MTSPLAAIRAQIVSDWEAATPPDRTGTTYHEVESRMILRGTAGDRAFFAHFPRRNSPMAEAGVDATQVEWSMPFELRLTQSGRSVGALVDAIANEGTLLARAIETRSSWPAGTVSVITGEVESERDDTTGDAILTFNLTITTAETD